MLVLEKRPVKIQEEPSNDHLSIMGTMLKVVGPW